MSEWLSIIIVILIVGIVLDGIRRARNSRKSEIKLSRNARKVDRLFEKEQQTGFTSELPSGGARPKDDSPLRYTASSTTGTSAAADSVTANSVTAHTAGGHSVSNSQPVQTSLDLNEPVPMLMDSVVNVEEGILADDDEDTLIDSRDETEPTLGNLNDIDDFEEAPKHVALPKEHEIAPERHETEPEKRETKRGKKSSLFDTLSDTIQSAKTHAKEAKSAEHIEKNTVPSEILIVNIIARHGARIHGGRLLEVFSEEKLKYGQMGIFHRHLDNDGDAPVVYSLANIVEPGSFDLADIQNSETPGVCVFLTLPCAGNAISAYDDMIETSTRIANALDCELSDENRSNLTKQTIEHGRQRVVEFERKNRLRHQT